MIKSDKIMLLILALVVMITICGSNYSSAADVNTTVDEIESTEIPQETYNLDENIQSNEESKIITKNKNLNSFKNANELKDLSIYAEDVTCNYGEVANINVVTDPEVDEGVLSLYIKDRLRDVKNLSLSTPNFQLRTSSYIPGTYNMEITYSSSHNYSSNVTNAILTINKLNSQISNVAFRYDENNDITVSLNVLSNDEILDFGSFNVYSEDELIKSFEIESGDVSFNLDKKYNLNILKFEYIGDDYYENSQINQLIYLNKLDLSLYLPYLNAYHSQIINQTVNLYSNQIVNDGKLHVYIDDVLVESYDVTSNKVDISIDSNSYIPGNYSVTLEYVDSAVYNSAIYETNLNIRQIPTTTYAYNITSHKNETVNLRANVYNYVDETNEGLLEFFLDDESIFTYWINNVSINESYFIGDNISYGEHNLRVFYHGSIKYASSEILNKLNIIKYSNSISVRNYTLNDEGDIVINVRAYSYDNEVDDGIIDYYVDGVLVGSVPVKSNITEIILPDSYGADNEYIIDLVYYDSQKFEDSNYTSLISPNKLNTSTRIYNFIDNKNILNITSYVYSTNYAEINEGELEFYLNDTLIGRASVENNQANIVYDMNNMPEQTYNLKVIYSGTKLYKNSENGTQINYQINRKTIYIRTNSSSITTTPSSKINITATLTDYNENIINITSPATITIDNQSYEAEFIEGKLQYEYTITDDKEEDSYNITIELPMTKYYKNATRTIRLNVERNNAYISSPNTIKSLKGDTILINATLNSNNQIINENIRAVLKINNNTIYQGMFENGYFQYQLSLDKYTDSVYNLTIKTRKTNEFKSAEKTIILDLSPRNTYITSKNIQSKNGENIIINATVFDSITRQVVKGTAKACIKINDVTLENINITNGHIVYSYVNDYSAKNYSITIIYGENGIYASSRWNGTLTITPDSLKIVSSNIITNAYSTINIKAKILDDNKPAQGIIKTAIKINNNTIMQLNVTDGIINVNYTLSDQIGSGNYNLTILAGPSRKYTNAISNSLLVINKNYKEIITEDITTSENSTIRITAKIVDKNHELISKNTHVNIKLAGKSIRDMNVTNGIIDFEYTLPEYIKSGNYDLLLQAGETSGYYHASTTKLLKVE